MMIDDSPAESIEVEGVAHVVSENQPVSRKLPQSLEWIMQRATSKEGTLHLHEVGIAQGERVRIRATAEPKRMGTFRGETEIPNEFVAIGPFAMEQRERDLD